MGWVDLVVEVFILGLILGVLIGGVFVRVQFYRQLKKLGVLEAMDIVMSDEHVGRQVVAKLPDTEDGSEKNVT